MGLSISVILAMIHVKSTPYVVAFSSLILFAFVLWCYQSLGVLPVLPICFGAGSSFKASPHPSSLYPQTPLIALFQSSLSHPINAFGSDLF